MRRLKTIPEISGRIYFLERVRDEYIKRKDHKSQSEARRILQKIQELHWVLGVKIENA